MTDEFRDASEREEQFRALVEAMTAMGERARLLSVQLAVTAAKVQQVARGRGYRHDDVLDLIARITRICQSVQDATSAAEKGLTETRITTPALWRSTEVTGVPDEETLARLEEALHNAIEMAHTVYDEIRQHLPEALPEPDEVSGKPLPWMRGSQDHPAG